MMMHVEGLLLAALLALGLLAAAAGAAEPDVLATLRKGHPRLFVTAEDWPRLRAVVERDPGAKDLYGRLKRDADRVLDAAPVRHKLKGPRLLPVSRRCLDRVSTLALVHHLSGEATYADRAIREMEAAAAFRDWNPSHFLDTAEMTAALGVGYDWLYDRMTEAQRRTVREAILEKGLEHGLRAYRGEAGYGWFRNSRHNWNQVCNGGLAQGALAVADEAPEVAREILASGLASVPKAMASFGVDGGWGEGPGYWGYTMKYTSRYLDALRTALGSMHGLEKTPGLAEAGMFRIYGIGPSGETFNFADAGPGAGRQESMFWLARTFDRPAYAAFERTRGPDDPLALVWYTPAGRWPDPSLPPAKHFRGVGVVFFRSAWDDPDALWVGAKGGDNKTNHANLDLGTFVLEARGVRWAVELGRDNYNLPAYFGAKRWTYYRMKTEGQNCLVLGGENQDTRAVADVVAFHGEKSGAGSAVIDLTDAYPMASSVRRGIAAGAGRVRVQDEVRAEKPVEVVWGMHTEADVACDGTRAVLARDGKRLGARIVEPAGAVFETRSAKPPPPENPNEGITKLAVRLPEKVADLRLVVDFAAGPAKDEKVTPLDEWPGAIKE